MVNPENIIVRRYTPKHYTKETYSEYQKHPLALDQEIVWMEVNHLDDLYALEDLAEFKKVHPILLENLHMSSQRARLEVHENTVYILTHLMNLKDGHLELQPLTILMFEQLIIAISEKPHDALDELKIRCENPSDPIRKKGLDFLLYTILDDIVDDYNEALDEMTELIDADEVRMMKSPTLEMMSSMQEYKKSLHRIYRTVWPMREILNRIVHDETPYMGANIALYHRDVLDHLYQILDVVDLYREIVSSMMEVYLSSLSIRMNEIMKVLTIISTIFMPLTFIVGVYGMNFKHMPEFSYPYAYPILLVVMVGLTFGMVAFFKHKKWL